MENITGIKDLFTDKKDKNYLRLTSTLRFFDLFASKDHKCSVLIPETIIISNGAPKYWLFNSNKDPSRTILMRKPKSLNALEIFRRFSPLKKEVEACSFAIQIIERIRYEEAAHNVTNFVRCTDGEKFLASGIEVLRLFEDRPTQIYMVQEILDVSNKSDYSRDTYYCYYRNDTGATLPSFSFFKKTFFIAEQTGLKQPLSNADRWARVEKSPGYPTFERKHIDFVFNQHLEDLSSDPGNPILEKLFGAEQYPAYRLENELSRGNINKLTPRRYYKSVDAAINQKLEALSKELIQYIERSYKIRVRKVILKYLENTRQQVVFIGCEELLFDLLENSGYEINRLSLNIKANEGKIDLETLKRYQLDFVHDPKRHNFNYNDPNVLNVEEGQEAVTAIRKRPMSTHLFSKMIIPMCEGDFCDFYLASVDKALYEIPEKMKTKITIVKKEPLEDFIHIPYQIPRILKIKCREYTSQTAKLLLKNLIYPLSVQNLERIEPEELEAAINKTIKKKFDNSKKEFSNLDNLYRNLGVCKTCFTIYSIMSKYFKERKESFEEYKKFHRKMSAGSIPKPVTCSRDFQAPSARHSKVIKAFQFPQVSDTKPNKPNQETHMQKISKERSSKRASSIASLNLEKIFSVLDYNIHSGIAKLEGAAKKRSFANKAMSSKASESKSFGFDKPIGRGNISELKSRASQISHGSRMSLGLMVYTKNENPEPLQLIEPEKSREPQSSTTLRRTNLFSMFNTAGANQFKSARSPSAAGSMQSLRETPEVLVRTPEESKIHESFGKGARSSVVPSTKPSTPTNQEARQNIEQIKPRERKHKIDHRQKSFDTFSQVNKIQKAVLINTKIVSTYHKFRKFMHLRVLPSHRITTPSKPLTMDKFPTDLFAIPLDSYCETAKLPMPKCSNETEIKFFIYDYEVGVPYLVLKSLERDPQKQDLLNPPRPKTLIILHDVFDSFIEYIELYNHFLLDKVDMKIVLFNIPGQDYTKYNEQDLYRSSEMSSVVDTLLNYLEEQKAINFMKEDLFFIGFGYGANILANLLGTSESSIQSVKGLLMFNGFTYLSASGKEAFERMTEVFLEIPREGSKLPFDYYSVLCSGKSLDASKLQRKMALNKITIPGRQFLLKGLESIEDITLQLRRMRYPMFAVQSDKSVFVPAEMIDQMLMEPGEYHELGLALRTKESLGPVSLQGKLNTKKPVRMSFYYDGPHNIMDHDEMKAIKIIEDFLECANKGFENMN